MISENSAIVTLIEKDNLFLIGKKREKDNHPLSGQWHIPGGKVLPGEDFETALKREMKEETNLDLKIDKLFGQVIRGDGVWRVNWYLCHPINDIAIAGDDLTDIRWVTSQEILDLKNNSQRNWEWPEKVVSYLKEYVAKQN